MSLIIQSQLSLFLCAYDVCQCSVYNSNDSLTLPFLPDYITLIEPKDKRGPHKHLFSFNITTIKRSEKIGHASLRIFKRRSRLAKPRGHFKLTVYRMAIPWKKNNKRWKKKLVYLDSKLVKCRREGEWIDFNVTSAVKFWANYKTKNYGLWVSVRGYRVPSSDFNVATGGRKDPFLVEFGIDRKKLQKAREVKEENEKNEVEGGDGELELHKESLVEATRARSRRSMSNLCKRHSLFVKFHDLNWDDWIIAPRGFSAYYCMGTCPEIIEKYFNPTNHAIIQNLIHHRRSKAVPAACCVPTKLHSITMLYFELDGSIVMKEYGEMVASSCGCR